MAAYSNLHLVVKFTSLSPVIDNPSFHLDYFTTYTTQDISDVSSLVSQVAASLNSTPAGGTVAVGTYLSTVLSRSSNQSLVDVYDVTGHLNGTPAGSPVLASAFTLSAAGTTGVFPEGVACVITLQAPYGTDVEFAPGARPRARDRGRIYFGPISASTASNEAVTNRTYVGSGTQTNLTKWIKSINVITTTSHTVIYNLAVWSRKNAAMKSLQECWVDDRYDYVRL